MCLAGMLRLGRSSLRYPTLPTKLNVPPLRYLSNSAPDRSHELGEGPGLEYFLDKPVEILGTEIKPGMAGRTPRKELPKPKVRKPHEKKPEWFKAKAPMGEQYQHLKKTVKELNLATVCEEAKCPNIGECWSGNAATATIMIMGDTCTRACRFCHIKTAKRPPPLDPDEPPRVAKAILDWGLKYVVFTMVNRDDLSDGGAAHVAETVRTLKADQNAPWVEALVGDFEGNPEAIKLVADAGLDVYAHNIETVRECTPFVRDRRADYDQSMWCLQFAKEHNPTLVTKSSIMVGCGETEEQVIQTMRDLRAHNVDILTLGQYLRPTTRHMPVAEYVKPAVFDKYKEIGEDMGFAFVASGPLVRSSYKAGEFFLENYLNKRKGG